MADDLPGRWQMKIMQIRIFLLIVWATLLSGCASMSGLQLYEASKLDPLIPYQLNIGEKEDAQYFRFSIGTNPTNIVFFVGGSGCTSLKNYLKPYLSGLNNVTVYALQKLAVQENDLGVFGCNKEFAKNDFYASWVARQEKFIKTVLDSVSKSASKILILGVSEGADVSIAIANSEPRITHLAIIGSGGYNVIEFLHAIGRMQGKDEAQVSQEINDIFNSPESIEKTYLGLPYKYWASLKMSEPLKDLLRLNIPIILGFGEKDRSVPLESVELIREKFIQAGKSNLKLIIYPNSDHALNSSDGHSYRKDFIAELNTLLEPK